MHDKINMDILVLLDIWYLFTNGDSKYNIEIKTTDQLCVSDTG